MLAGCASGEATSLDNETATTGTTVATTDATDNTASTTTEGTTADTDPCEPGEVESCELDGCSAGLQLCDADGMAGECICACPMGGDFVEETCQSDNLECPEDTVASEEGCVGQQVSGYTCPDGGAPTDDICVPSMDNPRTDIECGEGGSSLVGMPTIANIPHCGLNQNLAGSEDAFLMLPECDIINDVTYRAFEGNNGYTVCAAINVQMYMMVYVANRVIGGSAASYPGEPMYEDVTVPPQCPEGWEPLGEDMCQYAATIPE